MKPARGFTMLELIVSLSVLGILSLLCVPTFTILVGRARQSEAKSNLRALWELEVAYYMANDTFSGSVAKIGFAPTRGNRYQYNLNGTSSQNADNRTGSIATTPSTADAIMIDTFTFPNAYKNVVIAPLACGSVAAVTTGVLGRFVASAQGNLDHDSTADQWSISSDTRDMHSCPDVADNVAEGDPANEQDDTNFVAPDDDPFS